MNYSVRTTVLFHTADGALLQRASLSLDSPLEEGPFNLSIAAQKWKKEFSFSWDKGGRDAWFFDIPALDQDTECLCILSAGDEKWEKIIKLKNRRRWEVHIQNFTHTDIGYTDLPSRVAKSCKRSLKKIIEFCERTADYDIDSSYKWNVEIGYWLENALEGLTEEEREKVKTLVREGRIDLCPLYVSHTSDFNDEETSIRSLYFVFQFAEECGAQVKCAMASDSPGQPMFFPQLFLKSGVKYFSTAVNATMAKAPKLPRPFYWKSPDGAKILVLDTDERQAYQEGVMVGLPESYEKSERMLPLYLEDLEEDGKYDYPLIALRTPGSPGDNTLPTMNVSDIVKKWNETWTYPKLTISTYTQFFEKFEQKYGDQVKIFSGAWPDWWALYNGASAFETGVNRHTHGDLIEGERLAALLYAEDQKSYPYPGEDLRDAYRTMLLADEADWSAYSSVTEPDGLQARGQKAEEAAFVYQSAVNAREIVLEARKKLGDFCSPNTRHGIAVVNMLSWKRSGTVRAEIPASYLEGRENILIKDSATGETAPCQVLPQNPQTNNKDVLFIAQSVPAMGFKVYDIFPSDEPSEKKGEATGAAENLFYCLQYDKDTGRIFSIKDKDTGTDLLDPKSEYAFNQLIYEYTTEPRFVTLKDHMGLPEDVLFLQPYYRSLHDFYDYPKTSEILRRVCPENQKLVSVKQGELFTEIVTTASLPLCPKIESRIILDNYCKRIRIENYLEKTETLDTEGVYYAFPFKADKPEVRLDAHGGYFQPETEQLPGSSRDWYCSQKWINVSDENLSITWTSVEAPLIQLGSIRTGQWLDTIDITNGTIFSFVMNNYWWTNSPASQGGRYLFRYALTSGKPRFDPAANERFGWELHAPLGALVLDKKEVSSANPVWPEIEPDIPENVVIIGLKKAENSTSLIVRFMENSGSKCDFSFGFSNMKIKEAYFTTPVEKDIAPVTIKNRKAKITLCPYELVTIRIDLQSQEE